MDQSVNTTENRPVDSNAEGTALNPSTTEAGTTTGTEVAPTTDGATVAPSTPSVVHFLATLDGLSEVSTEIDLNDSKAVAKRVGSVASIVKRQAGIGAKVIVTANGGRVLLGRLFKKGLPPSAKGRAKDVKAGKAESRTEARDRMAAEHDIGTDDVKRYIRAYQWLEYAADQGLTITETDDKGNVVSTRTGVPLAERYIEILDRPIRDVSKHLKNTYGVKAPPMPSKGGTTSGDGEGTDDEARAKSLVEAEAKKVEHAKKARIERAIKAAKAAIDKLVDEGASGPLSVDLPVYLEEALKRVPINAQPDVPEERPESSEAQPEEAPAPPVADWDQEGFDSMFDELNEGIDPKLAQALGSADVTVDGKSPKGKGRGKKASAAE